MHEINALFSTVRDIIDPMLILAGPAKNSKPYPIGQCLEISLAVSKYLNHLEPSTLASAAPEQGYAALKRFLQNGGTIRQVWGDLRGDYFQNAFLAGTLYIDVANDTVVTTKPKVEILQFEESGLTAIEDYHHFSRIAARYWKATVVPNHLLPSIAPFYPLIMISPDKGISLQSNTSYMLALTQRQGFRPSEAALSMQPMGIDLFRFLARRLAGLHCKVAATPEQGLEEALQHCRECRNNGPSITKEIRAQAAEAGQRLESLLVGRNT